MSKTAIISGASSGIGAATAQKFIELGYTVVNIARRKSPVDNVINVSADLRTEEGAKHAAAQAAEAITKNRQHNSQRKGLRSAQLRIGSKLCWSSISAGATTGAASMARLLVGVPSGTGFGTETLAIQHHSLD